MTRDRFITLQFKRAGKNKIEKLIAKQDAPWTFSHVELQFSDGSSFSSRAGVSGDKRNGTSFAEIDYNPDEWVAVPIPVDEVEESLVKAFCVRNAGESYDFTGVAAFKCWMLHQDPEKWFCSEVCITALQEMGRFMHLIPHKISPNTLYLEASYAFPHIVT